MSGRMPVRRWAAGRGALLLIALMFISSAGVRLSNGTGAALAREIGAHVPHGGEAPPDRAAASPADISPDLVKLLDEVKAREAKVSRREAEIDARMQVLNLVETRVGAEVARLQDAEAALRATMAAADKAAENDLARLTAVYENMKPDQAVPLFQRMEPSFAAGFLGRMRPDAAAAILSGLEPELAYSISVELAGRNADVPREPVPAAPLAAPSAGG